VVYGQPDLGATPVASPDPEHPRRLLFWYFTLGPALLFAVALGVVLVRRRIRSKREQDGAGP
jgi:hypothetical protein